MPRDKLVTRACDVCREKRRKCDDQRPCGQCVARDDTCTFTKPQRKRGRKAIATPPSGQSSTTSSDADHVRRFHSHHPSNFVGIPSNPSAFPPSFKVAGTTICPCGYTVFFDQLLGPRECPGCGFSSAVSPSVPELTGSASSSLDGSQPSSTSAAGDELAQEDVKRARAALVPDPFVNAVASTARSIASLPAETAGGSASAARWITGHVKGHAPFLPRVTSLVKATSSTPPSPPPPKQPASSSLDKSSGSGDDDDEPYTARLIMPEGVGVTVLDAVVLSRSRALASLLGPSADNGARCALPDDPASFANQALFQTGLANRMGLRRLQAMQQVTLDNGRYAAKVGIDVVYRDSGEPWLVSLEYVDIVQQVSDAATSAAAPPTGSLLDLDEDDAWPFTYDSTQGQPTVPPLFAESLIQRSAMLSLSADDDLVLEAPSSQRSLSVFLTEDELDKAYADLLK
eukprot:CAMPEP_0170747750 /NCGR_PEP_ID=MMETSP0437-20130122/9486_1 /TAXON_ID=0 /ORGANISM="Sexangularia sp." /LENGTH=457 /DNA_ID=CAMNT_0011086543 /DNA_START=31 /DNA_END=1404 /DNA_ORIENTATION=+